MKSASSVPSSEMADKRGYSDAHRGHYRYAKGRPVFMRLKARFEHLMHTVLPRRHLGDAAQLRN